MRPLPFHIELASYFHALVQIFTRSDAPPEDFSTVFGFSILPYYMIHLALQRAHDDKLPQPCGATVCPPALRPNIPEDVFAQYAVLAQDARFAHMAFPDLGFGREIPPETRRQVQQFLSAEHRDFINHL